MADKHEAKDSCKNCVGSGVVGAAECKTCSGTRTGTLCTGCICSGRVTEPGRRSPSVSGGLVRDQEGRNTEPSAGSIDARTVRGASTVTSPDQGNDGGKKISGRKQFGVSDTNGLLLAVHVTAANVSDNVGGIDVMSCATRLDRSSTCGATPVSSAPSSSTAAIITSR